MSIETAVFPGIPYLLLLVGLALTVFTDSYISRLHKRILLIVVALTVSLIIQNVVSAVLDSTPHVLIRIIIGIYGYSVRPAIIVLFCYFFNNRKGILPAWCLVGLNAALHMTALFSPITFTYKAPHYGFVRGPLGFTSHIVGAVLLLWLLVRVFYEYRDNKKEMIFPIMCVLFISAGVLFDTLLPLHEISPLAALTVAIAISCVFVYFWFHVQFVRRYQADLMTQNRIRVMVSQIQPHFLFNTIATFRALCKRDPDKAAEVAEKFGQYLRQNLDSIDSEDLIPFEKELEHTKVYADIEMVRFENVKVNYNILDRDFLIPPLTVQPMVENAIRHGVRSREEGVIWVRTRMLPDYSHEIVISDNGVGFDPARVGASVGSHIGLSNVCERIEKLCGGTLTIESAPGEGTTVTIHIPAKEESR